MPTPVASARACLAGDAARALDDAVAVARRRSHAQTTSLHVVSALLSPSFSSALLRDALARARSAAYSPRLQFKALELCFGVALDRLSSAHPPPAEPPVSNSLMAAIKRSQANQRRNPDTFHLYNGAAGAGGATAVAGVKVELQQMVMAILDDPVVSRVFGEAGFRSYDIKIAVLRPPAPILRFPRSARCPPLFLFNFDSPDAGDENSRRIGEILAKTTANNPILVGIGAADAARDFTRALELQNPNVLPSELQGVKMVSIEKGNEGDLEEKVRNSGCKGVVVSVGDLKGLVEDEGRSTVVAAVTKVMDDRKAARVWVMGWSATYELYMKLLSLHPSLDKAWNLQLLPITSLKNGIGSFNTRPQSLMDSFVPFGGFFPLAYESKSSLSSQYQSIPRCQLCNEMYEQEVAAMMKTCSAQAEKQDKSNLPSWLQSAESSTADKGLIAAEAKDDNVRLNAKVEDLQKKWNDNCKHLHRGFPMSETHSSRLFPHLTNLQCVPDKGIASSQCSNTAVNQKQSNQESKLPISDGLQIASACSSISVPVTSETENNFLSRLQVRVPENQQLQIGEFRSCPGTQSDLGGPDDHASPSVTSVTTDLILGTPREVSLSPKERLQDFSGCSPPKKVDSLARSIPEVLQSYSYSCSPVSPVKGTSTITSGVSPFEKFNRNASTVCQQSDPIDYKAFLQSLIHKVRWQEEAICAITRAILRCKTGPERLRGASLKGDIWFSFLGPDKVAKQRIAVALSELMFGSMENFIHVDLGFQDGIARPNAICDWRDINGYDMKFRGKTITDRIAAVISKKPWSVIFLENVDKADFLVQNSLLQSIQTGKFSDSNGREFSINNAIFITTAKAARGKTFSPNKGVTNFSEERILAAQGWQMKILIEPLRESVFSSKQASVFVTKRKLDPLDQCSDQLALENSPKQARKSCNTFLDLNLPVEEFLGSDTNSINTDENNALSDNSEAWIEEFFELMDETVNFKPFDFDALADCILKEITRNFHRIMGSECILEIDIKALEQILAATWLLEDRTSFNNWIEMVLCRSFDDAKRRCNATAGSVIRLIACQDAFMDEAAPGIHLPSRIALK